MEAAEAADTFSRLPRDEQLEWLSIFMAMQSPVDIKLIQHHVTQYESNPVADTDDTPSSHSLDSLPSAALTRILGLIPLRQVFAAQRISRSFSAAARHALREWKCLVLARIEKKHRLVMHKTETAGPIMFSQTDCLAWDPKCLDSLKLFTNLQVLVLERWTYAAQDTDGLQASLDALLTQNRLTLRRVFLNSMTMKPPEDGLTYPQLHTLSVSDLDGALVQACPSLRALECSSNNLSLRHLKPETMTHLKCSLTAQEHERLAAFVHLQSLYLDVSWIEEEDDSEIRNNLRHAIRCMSRLRKVYIYSANVNQFEAVISDLMATAGDLQCLWIATRDNFVTEACWRSLGSCRTLTSLYLDIWTEIEEVTLTEQAFWTFLQDITVNGSMKYLVITQIRVLDADGNSRTIEKEEVRSVIDQVNTETGREIRFADNINEYSWCSVFELFHDTSYLFQS